MIDRRAFLVGLVVACGCGPNDAPQKAADATRAAPAKTEPPGDKAQSASVAPQTKIPRVAMLVYGTKITPSSTAATTSSAPPATLFRNRLAELGHFEGKTILIEERYADGDPQRLAQLAREMVETKPDVIVAIAAAATAAARQATSTIPIVMVHAGSLVESGLAASLSRPGGNVTGTTSMVPELGLKQVELLARWFPGSLD